MRGSGRQLLAEELVELISGPLLDAQLAPDLSLRIEQTNHWLCAALVLNADGTMKSGYTGFHECYGKNKINIDQIRFISKLNLIYR